jgi:Phosphoglycerate dehydrogenase and related dehydrogenases
METWTAALRAALPGDTIVAWTGAAHDIPAGETLRDIAVAVVANPPPGRLGQLPALRLVQSAWAGVDALLTDPTLPPVPLARLIDPQLAADMAEAVLGHVLMLHRQVPAYRTQQQAAHWHPLPQPRMAERRVGVLGMGEMGRASATLLARVGFPVVGWRRSGGTNLPGVAIEHGPQGLDRVLAQADILVNLLPLTDETHGLLDARAFARLPHGAALINAGRGGHVVLSDLVAALDRRQLSHAVLDVFTTEPLPADDPLWSHADVTITPHVAAPTDPHSAAQAIAANIARWRCGQPPAGLVDRSGGY